MNKNSRNILVPTLTVDGHFHENKRIGGCDSFTFDELKELVDVAFLPLMKTKELVDVTDLPLMK
jgi:hypothetical protein